MTRRKLSMRLKVVLIALLAIVQVFPRTGFAKAPVKMKNFDGTIDVTAEGVTPFTLEGTASHLGTFTAYGEVEFEPGDEPGSLLGHGPVVFEAANGDLLVGIMSWQVDPAVDDLCLASIHFGWRDSAEFSDGTVVANTGRFVTDRPPGLVVIAIIAVLISLLLPAIQTAR